jgi:nitroimidazol reductase NimA-like FMN-containing flavoprotein (pyridoxamine 5'-phosphate oxidase superfamily)
VSEFDDQKANAIQLLDRRRVLALSTVGPDGWPHTSIVGYANVGLTLYFAILRVSEKFAHLQNDNRIAFAVGEEPRAVAELQEVYGKALAFQVEQEGDRREIWDLLGTRHGNLDASAVPDPEAAVLIRAEPKHLTVIDYTKAFGSAESFDVP